MDETLDASNPHAGAVCSQHPESPAVLTCQRCGSFACEHCVAPSDERICNECMQRDPLASVGFVLQRTSWTLSNVLQLGWRTIMAKPWSILGHFWLLMIPYFVVIALPVFAILPMLQSGDFSMQDMYSPRFRLASGALTVVAYAIGSPLLLATFAYAAARLQGRPAGFGLIGAQLSRVGAYATLVVLIMAVTGPISLLQGAPEIPDDPSDSFAAAFAPYRSPGLWLSLLLSWPVIFLWYTATVELVLDRQASAIGALKNSIANIRRRPVAWFFSCLALGAIAVLSMSCCLLPSVLFAPVSVFAFTAMCMALRTT
ncbi:MAG: B-box zinc finger protein [Myxococcales bacterium]|nr:B-box zinc finger protein [Myxococcales bacterium]